IDPSYARFESGGSVTVDSTHVHGGKYAFHVNSDASASTGGLLYLPNVEHDVIFARAFIYLPAPKPLYNFSLFELTGTAVGTGQTTDVSIGGVTLPWGDPTGPCLSFLIVQPGHYDTESTKGAPIGEWACWEWELDTPAQKWRVWINGDLYQ